MVVKLFVYSYIVCRISYCAYREEIEFRSQVRISYLVNRI